ncbi:hypothetical protein NITLEN_50040 [Nitrospira lenta]|uniref:Uncharacterized protein n=1 Tax=Nitrospira lenta TaxID=1436998 RepID=A0A330L8G9_9BACT|nr:hypothetical protein NITLEN_50040 [Nitrospira lenta]
MQHHMAGCAGCRTTIGLQYYGNS